MPPWGDVIQLKLDLHVHSRNSRDGFDSVDSLLAAAKKRGLSGIAITDHDAITLKRSELRNGMLLLQGAEISTKQGHILAYNYGGEVKSGIDAFELVEKVREENGITIVAHPFGIRKNCLRDDAFRVKAHAIERFNGKSIANNAYNFLRGNLGTGGSDAHIKEEVGNAHTEFPVGCESIDDVLECIRKRRFDAKWNPYLGSLALAKWKKIKRLINI